MGERHWAQASGAGIAGKRTSPALEGMSWACDLLDFAPQRNRLYAPSVNCHTSHVGSSHDAGSGWSHPGHVR